MISTGKELYDLIDAILKPYDFKKKGYTWYLDTKECICFLTIIKSPFAGRYEDVFGCFVKAINPKLDKYPKFNMNNLAYNLHEFIGKEQERKIFDLEDTSYKGAEREEEIKSIIETYIIPFLIELSTENGIKKALQKHKNLKYYLTAELQDHFQISVD
jgi:hypothetical protein